MNADFRLFRYYGGNAHFFGDRRESWVAWETSVPSNPWMFGAELAPITDLVDDASKKQALDQAVKEHLKRAYIRELLSRYSALVLRATDRQVRGALNAKIENMRGWLSMRFGSLSVTDAHLARLSGALDKPNWFLHNTKLCYRWYPDGDGGQCGGGVGRHLCAPINSMTPYYRDDTDRRGGGCRMSWGITSYGYQGKDNWFAGMSICYRWHPDGDGGQCGGGAGRMLCARVNQYTPYYRDDTDRRSGGCQMSWRIVVPHRAPLWIRMAKLCYYWYPDGGGGQCGGGAGRQLCAVANQWTPYYKDDTDRRSGGCRMSWGIKSI